MACVTLKNIPEEIYNFIVDVQGTVKKSRQISQYSLESTIYKILNDSRRCVEENMRNEAESKPKK